MDDYKITNLSEAKNEYSARLVNILAPLIIQGLKSIFDEAKKLCIENDEHSKYLMTFQNFLARVPKWNSNMVEEETQRVVTNSQCNYLEDLITCVHIAQLKILTSIRVGQQQKKIEIDIPKLNTFVHKIYILVARKVYSNVYLFEDGILPLNYQKNMRECDLIVRECILNVIRDGIPVESILRSYIDDTVEEEVEVQEEIIDVPQEETEETEETKEAEKTEETKEAEKTEESKVIKVDTINTEQPEETKKEETKENEENKEIEKVLPTLENVKLSSETTTLAENVDNVSEPITKLITESNSTENSNTNSTENSNTNSTENSNTITTALSFNDVDNVLNMGTNVENKINAPKSIERLEEISDMRNEQRKLEEEEEEEEDDYTNQSLTIHGNSSIHLDTLDVHNLNKELKISDKPLLTGIEIIS